MFDEFKLKNMISNVPIFVTREQHIVGSELDFIKEKILESEFNNDIIRVARGEGRKQVMDSIILNSSVLFDWGEKSMHALSEDSEGRQFLEPNYVTKDKLHELIELAEIELLHHYNNNFYSSNQYKNIKECISDLKTAVEEVEDNEKLLLIKEWLCYLLHTGGNKKFSSMSPWVSTTYGDMRYKTAYFFAAERQKKIISRKNNNFINSRYVILDYWIPKYEETTSFRKTSSIKVALSNLGIKWYKDIHNEIMVKYALYPNRLIGYYYFENDNIQYYFVNPHYVDRWRENRQFSIGDYIYIDQSLVDFPSENPYRIIYQKYGNEYSIYSRR